MKLKIAGNTIKRESNNREQIMKESVSADICIDNVLQHAYIALESCEAK